MPLIEFFSITALKATIVLAAAFVAAAAMRRASAAARYLLWLGAIAAILALPLLSLSVKPVPVPVAGAPAVFVFTDPQPEQAPAPASTPASWLLPVWLCGVVFVLARVAIGHVRIWRTLRKAVSVDDAGWREKLGPDAGRVSLRRSVETEVPVSYGFLHPVILLPAQSTEWDEARLEIVLLHEMTHIRRRDGVARLIAQFACAVYWANPLAWLAAARLRQEQERSCDDAVVAAGATRSTYAEHLVALAGSVSESAIAMASLSGLEQRVRALLDPTRKRRALNGKVCMAALAAVLVCAIPFAALRAQNAGPRVSFSGSVLDPSGARVPNATIWLKGVNGAQETAKSGSDGRFLFQSIPAGKYDIDVNARGFARFQRSALDLSAASSADFNLEIGQMTETIEITAKGYSAAANPMPSISTAIEVGGNVKSAMIIRQKQPIYPEAAQAAGIEGHVIMAAIITKEGVPTALRVVNSADPMLVDAAMEAVKQWRYMPATLNAHPVAVSTTITVNFSLQQ
jgi:TonB family protein